MYLNEFARERLAADHARQFEGQANRSRLAAEVRGRHREGVRFRGRLIIVSCRVLRLDGVGAGRGRLSGLPLAPLARLEQSCTSCMSRTAACC